MRVPKGLDENCRALSKTFVRKAVDMLAEKCPPPICSLSPFVVIGLVFVFKTLPVHLMGMASFLEFQFPCLCIAHRKCVIAARRHFLHADSHVPHKREKRSVWVHTPLLGLETSRIKDFPLVRHKPPPGMHNS